MIPVHIFIGSITTLPDTGRPTGMFKHPAEGPQDIGFEGFVGDQQADRRVHGGPEKAVHLYPAEHYARLAEKFPEAAQAMRPGSLGENLSTRGLTEADVCIGDIYALGSARLQVCQPRSPCWKIDSRFGEDGIAAFIAETLLTGWYWRVLEPGQAATGDALTLVERPRDGITLAAAMAIWNDHRPVLADLERIAAAPGIAGGWQRKILERANWLRRRAGQP
ncbi:MAG TPA: MOSC domain-containing protein [Rhodocyclaceae bacterium]|nr:MOSC domain-containing protein [Rhodocyclaceae bacterium]